MHGQSYRPSVEGPGKFCDRTRDSVFRELPADRELEGASDQYGRKRLSERIGNDCPENGELTPDQALRCGRLTWPILIDQWRGLGNDWSHSMAWGTPALIMES
jgi:hypothetical protein